MRSAVWACMSSTGTSTCHEKVKTSPRARSPPNTRVCGDERWPVSCGDALILRSTQVSMDIVEAYRKAILFLLV
jgi:hypothetical protein